MTGSRFVHDTLEQSGWDVLIADAQKVKGLAPLAWTADKIDARCLGRALRARPRVSVAPTAAQILALWDRDRRHHPRWKDGGGVGSLAGS
jgi:hypothetical protein